MLVQLYFFLIEFVVLINCCNGADAIAFLIIIYISAGVAESVGNGAGDDGHYCLHLKEHWMVYLMDLCC